MTLSTYRELDRPNARDNYKRWRGVLFASLPLLFLCALAASAITKITWIGTVAIALLTIFMLVLVAYKMLLWVASIGYKADAVSPADPADPTLPVVSVMLPLYKEPHMVRRLVESVRQLEYPIDKIEYIFLTEPEDYDTRPAIEAEIMRCGLNPTQFRIITVPPGFVQTKPNAMNYGLGEARGDYVVVYDAEDRPNSDQLLKAVNRFRAARPEDRLACVQALLHFWNEDHSLVTRFLRAEYAVHYNWVLPGMARLGQVVPLGGTSNIFDARVLREIGGWDAYNVTEDADQAAALAEHGYSIATIQSYTDEEASKSWLKALRQRERWLKGWAITGLVHTDRPLHDGSRMGFGRWALFNMYMLGTPLSLMVNPIFWAMTIVYYSNRWSFINDIWPQPFYGIGVALMFVGNIAMFFQMAAGCVKQYGFGSVKWMLLIPVWFLFGSLSAFGMVPKLVADPYGWAHTQHEGEAPDDDDLLMESV